MAKHKHKSKRKVKPHQRASNIEFYICEHCDNLHIGLFNDDDELIAVALIDQEMLIGMEKAMTVIQLREKLKEKEKQQ